MKNLLVRFINEEDGDTVQNVIIIAIFAALALLFGKTVVKFVSDLIDSLSKVGGDAQSIVDEVSEKVY